jgi:triacylglycerol esterase/lipase EstA (alpha/beta hydrolase family)
VIRLVELLVAAMVVGCAGYVFGTYVLAFHRKGPAGLARVALVELGAVLLLMLLWPLWMVLGSSYQLAEPDDGRTSGTRHPVILLHGFFMNRTQWVWLGRRLAARGIGPLYGTSYFTPQPVRQSAAHLADFIERVRQREHAQKVDIVAHSLGGVVARYYIDRLGGAGKVGRLVTLGSPHKGTLLGRLGLGLVPSARELMHGSPLLDELRVARPGISYTSVWSRADAIIIPPESSSIAPLGEDRVFDDLGHLSMLLSPRVVDAVAERLEA